MRKGILSFSPLGRRKAAKPKTANMAQAEKAAARKPETPAAPSPAPEKQFVQTVQVPKPGKPAVRKTKGATVKARRPVRGK